MALSHNFTSGPIAGPLFRFALPVMGALLLQSLYGAVDLFIVGHFASSADVSAVSTGSQILQTFTMLTASFSMGITILLGQYIGAGRGKEGGTIAGSGICLCLLLGLFFTFCLTVFAPTFAGWMNAPAEAFEKTVSYIRICGGGMVVIETAEEFRLALERGAWQPLAVPRRTPLLERRPTLALKLLALGSLLLNLVLLFLLTRS